MKKFVSRKSLLICPLDEGFQRIRPRARRPRCAFRIRSGESMDRPRISEASDSPHAFRTIACTSPEAARIAREARHGSESAWWACATAVRGQLDRRDGTAGGVPVVSQTASDIYRWRAEHWLPGALLSAQQLIPASAQS